DVEHLHDVRMLDARRELRLFNELAGPVGLLAQMRVGELERDVASEAADAPLARQIDGRHPAARDREQELVAADALGEERLRLDASFTSRHLLPTLTYHPVSDLP